MTNSNSTCISPVQEYQHDYQAITDTVLDIRHATVHTSAYLQRFVKDFQGLIFYP